ncbi:hypothetical protein JCM19037_2854 [Geomicrobium sp. JCM 19037]|nr:hypothetical protein JCM19037_2854 [Geomicrobium sp. JCM 19037]
MYSPKLGNRMSKLGNRSPGHVHILAPKYPQDVGANRVRFGFGPAGADRVLVFLNIESALRLERTALMFSRMSAKIVKLGKLGAESVN